MVDAENDPCGANEICRLLSADKFEEATIRMNELQKRDNKACKCFFSHVIIAAAMLGYELADKAVYFATRDIMTYEPLLARDPSSYIMCWCFRGFLMIEDDRVFAHTMRQFSIQILYEQAKQMLMRRGESARKFVTRMRPIFIEKVQAQQHACHVTWVFELYGPREASVIAPASQLINSLRACQPRGILCARAIEFVVAHFARGIILVDVSEFIIDQFENRATRDCLMNHMQRHGIKVDYNEHNFELECLATDLDSIRLLLSIFTEESKAKFIASLRYTYRGCAPMRECLREF